LSNAVPVQKRREPLHIETSRPNEILAIDITGPLQTSGSGKKYILVMKDLFTRFVILKSLATVRGSDIAEAITEGWIQVFGPPEQLLSDNGMNLKEGIMRSVRTMLKIKPIFTTPYHPSSNGAVERHNAIMKRMLSKYVNELQDDWNVWVPLMAFAYNTTPRTDVGFSPFTLMIQRLPDISMWSPPRETTEEEGRLRKAINAAYSAMIKPGAKISKPLYQVGEEVWMLKHTQSGTLGNKLDRKMTGPYRVSKVTSAKTYLLTKPGQEGQWSAHEDHLRKYQQDYGNVWARLRPQPQLRTSSSIMKSKGQPTIRPEEFLVTSSPQHKRPEVSLRKESPNQTKWGRNVVSHSRKENTHA